MLISDPNAKPKIVVFPKKKGILAHLRQYFVLYIIFLIVACLNIWLGQQSINAYWQQTYHRASPLESLNRFDVWRLGGEVQQHLSGWYQKMVGKFDEKDEQWNQYWQGDEAVNNGVSDEMPVHVASHAHQRTRKNAKNAKNTFRQPEKVSKIAVLESVQLKSGDKVLFAGDSIMQGIAPHLQKWLKSRYQIDSINLSKQSTGLAYPKFFDWPTTIEQTFEHDKNVKLLIILVGANDPWDFPDPATAKGVPFLRFETDAWKQVYLQRVNRIVLAAKKAHAQVIWLGIPYMKRPQLNTQMHYLESILSEELNGKKDNVLWLPINRLLSDGADVYQDTMILDGESVRMRTKDGIHFSPRGQQFVADYVASYISFKDDASKDIK